jgi:hypothetical protein
MHIEHHDMSIWYGTPDAPAPVESVPAGVIAPIVIGVRPIDMNNHLEVCFRVNQGPSETITARWLRNDIDNKSQYFKVMLPAFRVGDLVEYGVVCYCGSRQVPSEKDATNLPLSFHVAGGNGEQPTSKPDIPELAMPAFNMENRVESIAPMAMDFASLSNIIPAPSAVPSQPPDVTPTTSVSQPEPVISLEKNLPQYEALASALQPVLSQQSLASLDDDQIRELTQGNDVSVEAIHAMAEASRLADTTGLPEEALFALGINGHGPNIRKGTAIQPLGLKEQLVTVTPGELRKKLESAVQDNLMSGAALTAFDAAKPALVRFQAHESPLKALMKSYDLNVPTSLADKLEAQGVKTLADLRSSGDPKELAKALDLDPDDTQLKTLAAHANLSFLGSDVPTNSLLIEDGYTALSNIAAEPEAMFLSKIAPSVGLSEAIRIKSTAQVQTAVLKNYLSGMMADQANGFQLSPLSTQLLTSIASINISSFLKKCQCQDCESAVSPLAYLADLMGYVTTKLGLAKEHIVPLYRLLNPVTEDHFYTQSANERDRAVSSAGYQYERIACYIFSAQKAGTLPLLRLNHPWYVDHFYTTDAAEAADAVHKYGYDPEEPVGFVYPDGPLPPMDTTALYRLMNDKAVDHFYTTDDRERQDAITDAGYREEEVKVAGYVPKEGHDRLHLDWLSQQFHQHFSDLPLSCEQVDERVRQVRICIEVLRSYVSHKKILNANLENSLQSEFKRREDNYRREAYQALLLRLGASFTELRAARGATAEDRQALADRLGIPSGDTQRDYLKELLLDLDTMTELDLERLFGLVDTTRDPLSHGAKVKEGVPSQLLRWNFNDVRWGINTDFDGVIHLRLSRSGGKDKVEVYRSSARTSDTLEASGEMDSSASTVVLSRYMDTNGRSNGLSGEVDVNIIANDDNLTVQVVPQMISWRLQKLRELWKDQDWIKDEYSRFKKRERLPVIDPDVIGPDDFRDLAGEAFTRLWKKRRTWLDELLKKLTQDVFRRGRTTPLRVAFCRLFLRMQQTTYEGATKPFWPAQATAALAFLQKGLLDKTDKDKLKESITDLWNRFKLTPEMLIRLMVLKKKHDSWVDDRTRNPALEAAEWEEVYNILVQAHKVAWYGAWIREEDYKNFIFGPKDFWISLREPKEGTWPPSALPSGIPYIDPELLKLEDLPDESNGQEAIDLWTERQDILKRYNQDLSDMERSLAGATERIKSALNVNDINILHNNYRLLLGPEPGHTQGNGYVENTLAWSEEAFKKVMGLHARLIANQTPQPPKPTDAEWAEMERLLTTKYKERELWQKWAQAEKANKLEYWDMLKAKLARWRGGVEARQVWQRALLNRSAPPLIDPDLLQPGHFRARRQNPAIDLWSTRSNQLSQPGGIVAKFRVANPARADLERVMIDALGPFKTPDRLQTLLDDAREDRVSLARLDQLSLSREALDFLARMHSLLAQASPQELTDQEWESIAAILTQVWKSRQAAEWRLEEEQQDITLSPDWFVIPSFASTTQFPPPKPPNPPEWRGVRSDVIDWEDRLQSRMDQEQAVIDGVRQAMSGVEESTLPMLRDALVKRAHVPGRTLSEQADWITENLLIDAKQNGCQVTSRVAQAIETLQQLLWSVRTGLLVDEFPNLQLLPVKMRDDLALEEFDEAWKWIGSYPMWRAAMFVFLYPENIMIPSLKGHQSPGHRQLVEDLRGLNRIVPSRFTAAIQRYYDYFNDICDLNTQHDPDRKTQVCFGTISNVWEESEDIDLYAAASAKPVSFQFGLTTKGNLYWRVRDRSNPDWQGESYWRRLKGFKNNISELIDCTVYQTPGKRRFLYIFAKTNKDGADKVELMRLDLESGAWDPSESQELGLPQDTANQPTFTAHLQPTDEKTIPYLFLTFPDKSKYRLTLGKKGDREDGTIQKPGESAASDWRPWQEVPATFQPIKYGHEGKSPGFRHVLTGASLCVYSGQSQELLHYWVDALHLDDKDRLVNQEVGYEEISTTLIARCVARNIVGGLPAWSQNDQNIAFVLPLTHAWPMGFAISNLPRDEPRDIDDVFVKPSGRDKPHENDDSDNPDLVIGYLSSIYPKNQTSEVCYRVGWDVQPDGQPTSLSNEFKSGISYPHRDFPDYYPIFGRVYNGPGGGIDVVEDGVKIAIGASPDGRQRFFAVFSILRKGSQKKFLMQVRKFGMKGELVGETKSVAGPESSFGADHEPTGVGLAFASLRNQNQLDIIVYYQWRPYEGDFNDCKMEYFIGWDCDLDTFQPRGGWTPTAFKIDPPPNKSLLAGGTITVADIDGNGRQDLIVANNGYINGDNGETRWGNYRIGFNFGLEASVESKGCAQDGYKLLTYSIPTPLQGLRPPLLPLVNLGSTETSRNLVYLEEAHYFVPISAALQLQKGGEHLAALDWFRLVYDYTLPSRQRKLLGLALAQNVENKFQREDEHDWLLDPLNPHAIARTRRNAYVRYTLLSIIKCLLDYGDSEFTQDTAESLPRARELYMMALRLLYEDELKPVSETCEGVLQDLEIRFGEKWVQAAGQFLVANIDQYSLTDLQTMRDGLQIEFERYQDTNYLIEKAREFINSHTPPPEPLPRFGISLEQGYAQLPQIHAAVVTEQPIAEVLERTVVQVQTTVPFASSEPGDSSTPSVSYLIINAPGGNGSTTAQAKKEFLLGSKPVKPYHYSEIPNVPGTWVPVSQSFCVPRNPVLQALRLRANLNLYKIRTCRNISGLKRELEVYVGPTDTQTGMPTIGAGGQLVLPGTTRIQPTPYRFQTLINRAKQLIQNAMQIEQAMLSALEKSDAEAYALLKAKQDMRLAKAGVTLQSLRVTEAQGGVKLATLQRNRAMIQIKTYNKWISAGLSELEKAIIGQYIGLSVAQAVAGSSEAALQQMMTQASGTNTFATAGIIGTASTLISARATMAVLGATISITQLLASQERRMEEWSLQKALAEQDYAIGDQGISMAEDHVRVAEQERTIAQMQADNAQEGVDFLSVKFTSKELYDWMSGILERVYSFFLQQATAVAQLAQSQLAFERQETPPSYIQADYWEGPSSGGSASANPAANAPDRRGLTGSARLLQDIYQLDQYAFDNDKSKLQLTKTISLAQLDPFAFQQFRETGILTFATPMDLFDRDFPGHYLRLIKRVRTSVIALIPPSQGIRAGLSSTGLSRVVSGGDIFQKISLRRDPETLALSSPINATGLFELDAQSTSEMLLPFEGTGVDTFWEFRMLKASNQLDYDTIADVLLTIEYTALNSFDYQQQVIQSPALTRPFSADRAYSFRREFADAWYDLHNPDQSDRPMEVTFETMRVDFPPNLSNLRIAHIVLYFASTTDKPIELNDIELSFAAQGGGEVGGFASTNEGVVSTRRGNAGPWTAMIGKSPIGQWTMKLDPDSQTVKQLFDEVQRNPQRPTERVADILLVVTYSGRTPEWPV